MKIYTKEETIQQYLDDGVPLEKIIFRESLDRFNINEYFKFDYSTRLYSRRQKDYLYEDFHKIFVTNTKMYEEGLPIYCFKTLNFKDIDNHLLEPFGENVSYIDYINKDGSISVYRGIPNLSSSTLISQNRIDSVNPFMDSSFILK